MVLHLTECRKCLSTSINTWFSIRSPRLAQAGAAVQLTCSLSLPEVWCNNSQPLVHDNEWISSLSFFFPYRAVDCVNLFNLGGFRLELTVWKLESRISLSDLDIDPDDVNYFVEWWVVHAKLWMAEDFRACWLSDYCVHPEGKLKSPSMHTGPWVEGLTYKCSLVAACVAGIGWANQISVVLKADERSRWMDGSIVTGRYKA